MSADPDHRNLMAWACVPWTWPEIRRRADPVLIHPRAGFPWSRYSRSAVRANSPEVAAPAERLPAMGDIVGQRPQLAVITDESTRTPPIGAFVPRCHPWRAG